MVIDLSGDSVCFSYSRNRKKPQMFFSSKIKTIDIAKTLRKADPLKERANILWTECKESEFCLDAY